jgi:hypothetical protein
MLDNQIFITVLTPLFSVNFLGDNIMKKKTMFLIIISTLTLPLAFTLAVAEHHTLADRGKIHFNNPEFAGGKRSCNSCHPNGKDLEGAGGKSNFTKMGAQLASLEDAINMCIIHANEGNVLKVLTTEMQEIVSYIKSLGKTATVKALADNPQPESSLEAVCSSMVNAKCTRCHYKTRICNALDTKSVRKWQKTIRFMVRQGAELTEDEQNKVVECLSSLPQGSQVVCD